jgi:hypothetical protein
MPNGVVFAPGDCVRRAYHRVPVLFLDVGRTWALDTAKLFGPDGPRRARPGVTYKAWSWSGVTHTCGLPGRKHPAESYCQRTQKWNQLRGRARGGHTTRALAWMAPSVFLKITVVFWRQLELAHMCPFSSITLTLRCTLQRAQPLPSHIHGRSRVTFQKPIVWKSV